MTLFDHYLYVLECGDKSYYTGYTNDVEARVAAHQAGKGAKYTKSHEPVKLIAQARFYTKERAMSAEKRFKMLGRAKKEELLALAQARPFENVLREHLPGFGMDTASEFVCRSLHDNVDEAYRAFQSKLIPTKDPSTIVGVRTPALRKIARELRQREDASTFLDALPHKTFDENQVHALAIGLEKDYELALAQYEEFLPYVDNWATCDQLPVKVLANDPDRTLGKVGEWICSNLCYTIRFAIGVLMRLYLEELFDESLPSMVAGAHMPDTVDGPASEDDIYYVNMMRAWYFAEALAKQQEVVLPYFERTGDVALLDEWTRRKAIQKAIESRRITTEMKDHLRDCR